MKSNNIIIGVLVAVVALMGVAFAAFSTTLTINGSASINSSWSITYTADGCTTVSKDQNIKSSGTIRMDGDTAIMTVDMKYPGDTVTCNVIATNAGSLAAKRTSWALTATGAITDPSYEVTLGGDTAAVLNQGDDENLSITVTYKRDVETTPSGTAKFEAQAVYEQALATTGQ